MQVSEIFAKRSRQRLEELEWSHADLARELGVAPSEVTRTLSGNISIRIDKFAIWAKKLRCRPEWLLGLDDEQSEAELRFACISALMEIDVKHLPIVRDYLKKMSPEFVDANAKSKKHGSS